MNFYFLILHLNGTLKRECLLDKNITCSVIHKTIHLFIITVMLFLVCISQESILSIERYPY